LSSAQQNPAPAGASASRVAELESQLAFERAQSTRMAREVERRLVEFRETVRTLRTEVRQAAEDRAQAEGARSAGAAEAAALRAEAETARTEAEKARADVARLEGELAQARSDGEREARDAATSALRQESESARASIALLERELAQARAGADERDALAARVGELESALASSRAVAAVAPVAPAADLADAATDDGGFPNVAGLRREGAGAATPFGVLFHARRCSDRFPVDVLVVAQAAATERLDSLPLARHANLVSALSSGVARDGAYVVLEHSAGETLERAVGRDGSMDELKALRIARQIAHGLRHAAAHDLLHGDLSPSSVRLAANDDAQVEHVGLGPMLPPAERPLTDARFAAPERLTGRDTLDQRADIYSLGALLAFLLTGAAPYDGDREAVQCAHAVGKTYDLREKRGKVSRDTSALVGSFLALDRSDRPQDWDAALGSIERVIARLAGDPDAGSWLDRLTTAIAGRPALACTLAVTPVVLAGIFLHVTANDAPAAQDAPPPARHAAPARGR
jgi:hypothetical protein